ncbi:hypothetical protein BGZ51_009710 [Haplosporangium sp. Z 767]|nr:hypothetical protein BGZ51_009710 [Haplosporangium sp. Z 767]
MTLYELLIDPERNAVIRRALAKRIVRQREAEEEEASTEEDESFLGDSVTAARKGSSASYSAPGSPSMKDQCSLNHNSHGRANTGAGLGIVGAGEGHFNARSRWKSEYRRMISTSPSGSFISTVSEIMPEILPEILPEIMLNGHGDTTKDTKDLAPVSSSRSPALLEVPSITTEEVELPSMTDTGSASKPELKDTKPTMTLKEDEEKEEEDEEKEPDPVEQDILLKLEELRKEKSRLFARFRSALQKKEIPQSTIPEEDTSDQSSSSVAIPTPAPAPAPIASAETTETRVKGASTGDSKQENSKRPPDQDHDRRVEPTRQNVRRREHDRIIDRSKLNLEIPRKPSISSASSNSTSSTPTTTFAPPASLSVVSSSPSILRSKRQRSISPSSADAITSSGNRGSGAGSFGSSYSDASYTSKYARTDYMGSHSRNTSNSNSNGLPEKPQVRYPYHHHPQHHHHHHASASSSLSSARALGGDSFHGEDNYHRSKNNGPGSSSLMSSGSNMNGGGFYRQNGSLGYHSQGPPPARIGFGDSGGGSRGGGSGGGGSGGNSGGGGSGGRGGYYGPSDGPPPHMSLLGPLGRALPFSRNMMQMPHARGLMQGRVGFGGGRGGPPERPMASGRAADWSRRRSRA